MERRSKGSRESPNTPCFVKKLYEMMSFNPKILSWVGSDAFEIADPSRLETEVLPVFFRHSRFQSLVRQLNFYAFRKISKERNSWVYSHAYFKRDRPELLDLLRRKTNCLHGLLPPNAEELLAGRRDKSMEASGGSGGDEGSTDTTEAQDDDDEDDDDDDDDESCEDAGASAMLISRPSTVSVSRPAHHPAGLELLPAPLQSFCVRRDPWRSSLVPDIRSLLAQHTDLEEDFFEYVRALEAPQSELAVRFNEQVLRRTFVVFAVSRLQMGLFAMQENNDPMAHVIANCLDAWMPFAKACL